MFLFAVTIIGVLATDLLIGVAIGIIAKFFMHMFRGVRPNNLFRIYFVIDPKNADSFVVSIVGAAIFTNFLALKNALTKVEQRKTIIIQLTNVYLIDHTVMEFIHDFQQSYEAGGDRCEFLGLQYHVRIQDILWLHAK